MSEVARRRVRAQGLVETAATPADAAAALLAVQAQDFAGARLALALRSTGRLADVDAALAAGDLVRGWPMRGTLMITARDDLRWLTELLAPRSFAAAMAVSRREGLVDRDFDVAREAAAEVLAGGVALSRPDLLAAIATRGVDTGSGRGSHLLRRLAGDALICFGPPRGTTQTFVLLSDWTAGSRSLDRDEALATLARRYAVGHAPATVRDLAWWSGLTLTESRRAVALAGLEAGPVGPAAAPREGGSRTATDATGDSGGSHVEFLRAPDAVRPEPAPHGDVRLLPPFDELLLGYGDRSESLLPGDFARVVPHSNGLFSPVVTLDGAVVGTWKGKPAGSAAYAVEIRPFSRLSAAGLAAVSQRAAEIAAAHGRAPELTVVDPA